MRIIHYYHIFADGRWQMLVNQHLMAVSNYGLANAIEEIRIGIVGQPANRKEVKAFLATIMPADRCKVVVERTTAWEQATLNEMYKASQEEPDAVYLYAHTKGGSDASLINQLWCRSMTFFCVVAWQNALEKLEGVDIAGPHWITKEKWPHMADHNNPHGYPYFGGNYWWARATHIAKLGTPERDHRWQAEHWIGKAEAQVADLCPGWPSPELFVITW